MLFGVVDEEPPDCVAFPSNVQSSSALRFGRCRLSQLIK